MFVDPKWMRYYARLSSAVMLKVVLVAAGYFGGKAIDDAWGTYPLATVALLSLGVGLGIWWIIRVSSKL